MIKLIQKLKNTHKTDWIIIEKQNPRLKNIPNISLWAEDGHRPAVSKVS